MEVVYVYMGGALFQMMECIWMYISPNQPKQSQEEGKVGDGVGKKGVGGMVYVGGVLGEKRRENLPKTADLPARIVPCAGMVVCQR